MENDVVSSGRSDTVAMLRVVTAWLAIALSCGCVTHPPVADVYPDHLDRIPVGARVTVLTHDGDSITMKVTQADATGLAGTDRHYRSHELRRDEMADVSVLGQNDTIVMLAWVAVVFATGL